jgi:predicted alpha/beta superfamily hydrolase
MKKIIAFLLCICIVYTVSAQYNLRLIVTDVATKKLDDIYISGSFNNWNPDDANYKLKPFGGSRKAIVLKDIPAGKYEFKFTRGNWDKVESTAKGEAIENRVIYVDADTSVNITIDGWADDYPQKPKPNTASARVQLLDSVFKIPQLNRTRRIWVYLPKSYDQLKAKNYPVLYMHDGQNVFNEQTSSFGEWGVDECLDTLQKQTGKECIVIAIANGDDKRLNEYNPYDNAQYGKGEGNLYVDFIVKTLKPFIDKQYRTLKDVHHTYIAGSSMGGLISLYAIVKYPDVFGAAGIFSPSFWIAPQLYTDVANAKWTTMPRFYFYAGGKESETMISDMDKMIDVLQKKNANFDVRRSIYPLGQHKEKYWREEFDDFYRWIMN